MSIRMVDLYWSAGFLDGEGSFSLCAKHPRVQATQSDMGALEKLKKLFGGAIYPKKLTPISRKPLWSWVLQGKESVGLMMTLYTLLSSYRQEQIRHAVKVWYERGASSGQEHAGAVATDEEALELMRRIKAGESMNALEQETGISHTTMSMWMRGTKRSYLRQKLEGPNAPPPIPRNQGAGHRLSTYTDEQVLAVIRRIRAGEVTMYRVAKDLGLSDASVRAWAIGTNRPYLLRQVLAEEQQPQDPEAQIESLPLQLSFA